MPQTNQAPGDQLAKFDGLIRTCICNRLDKIPSGSTVAAATRVMR